jgi:hypothetical protein
VIHCTWLTAVHVHPDCVVTSTALVAADAGAAKDEGAIEYVHAGAGAAA